MLSDLQVVSMRLLTREYFEYQRMADSYHFPFHEVDPRASRFDEGFYQELVRRGTASNYSFTDALRDLAFKLPKDRIPELPTREDVIAHMREKAQAREAERARIEIPEDVLPLIADVRVFSNYVMSPEVADHCRRMRDSYIAKEDEYKGRWLWHMLEDIPRLGEDAVELSMRLMSTFSVKREGCDIVLKDYRCEIVLRDASSDTELPESLRVLYPEVYREDGEWNVCTTSGPRTEIDFRASSFEVRDTRENRW